MGGIGGLLRVVRRGQARNAGVVEMMAEAVESGNKAAWDARAQ